MWYATGLAFACVGIGRGGPEAFTVAAAGFEGCSGGQRRLCFAHARARCGIACIGRGAGRVGFSASPALGRLIIFSTLSDVRRFVSPKEPSFDNSFMALLSGEFDSRDAGITPALLTTSVLSPVYIQISLRWYGIETTNNHSQTAHIGDHAEYPFQLDC